MFFIAKVKPAKFLTKFADEKNNNSLSTKLRQKRFVLFKMFLTKHYNQINGSLKIIDVGGRPTIWEQKLPELQQIYPKANFEITVANIQQYVSKCENIRCIVADARNMKQFKDKEFDIVFSNSVIEHVGNYEDQEAMAKEVLRIGKNYFVQTPNFYFLIEPHFLFPCFQFLPQKIQVWLITNFDLGWIKKTANQKKAVRLINSIKLLRKKQLLTLFPGANVFEEKFFCLTKSFIMCGESSISVDSSN
ncbi:class I SAM-dependent methyltransferase [Gloeocapsopsis dulcis]|uniref:Methyltransferase type 11 n=1 Tax=Gloeocapsopsis dulcis AAB1 = 1H9 TaxID=1433147 RepID=A0A6N8FRR1_9CHRO|nr:class I SAM-dependent methyltransferase [Gloeocapsopsis dulcis]MUL35820.1 methyltransferase type 11 [Gloeocapsopsis dulcis AAB1 = 1H9]WNN87713.1 class I SAM-dependent methyltransferase [Gloeocapsopsis dulcis]